MDVYLLDSNLARELNIGQRCPTMYLTSTQRRMRQKLRSSAGQAVHERRKGLVEPVLGTLKEQRGMKWFQLRIEQSEHRVYTATIAYNLTQLYA